MKTVLVTGAAGFLGSHLCDTLLEEGYRVVGVDNLFRGKLENLPEHKNFNFFECDCLDIKLLHKIFDVVQPEIVIHYAAINGTRYFYDIPFKVCEENIRMTQNILSCSSTHSYCVKKIVYASSSEIYGPTPKVPTEETEPIELYTQSTRDSYASSKAMGEFLVKIWAEENDKDYIIIRPFNTYGERMATNGYGQVIPEFIERIKHDNNFFMYGNGKQTRSFCYVKDHTDIVIQLIKKTNNEIVNVGFDEEVTIYDLAKMIHTELDVNFSPTFKDAWSNDTKWRKPDISKMKSLTNKTKFIPLKEGICKMIKERI